MVRWFCYLLSVVFTAVLLGGCAITSERSNSKVQIKSNPGGTFVKVHSNQKYK